ncbi:metal ABC transporter substrate-binding protein [Cellulomonas denverensis]|uniref:Zinc ABC transporter substrate-binding protein n=1 Tax=Cellulomonas denverensis TaxID=264297 RepID=A0A7X6KWT7_9CELL|nr:metal ABC transporter substrate-binding protein [Cellulomonas denverensis]NKY23712.1 zinc ABC transporter substrate-binding protein [Cellulomonas denverensis]GIG26946.1 zinc ABC transporter substrate-binding protein [Cellulomonas denverensis]
MRTPRRSLLLTAGLAVTGLALSACSSGDGGGGSGDSGDGVAVLASFYPLQYIAEQVGGEHVTVSSLTPPGAEPHDLELSPSQVDQLGRADLVVYLSDFQASVDEAVAANPPSHVIDAADDVTLHAAEHTEDEDEDGHDHGSEDPHFWLNPTLLPQVADDVAAALGEIDPDHADDFTANAAAFAESMADLDQRYTEGLATCAERTIVTTHEAFGYLAEQYDLEQVGISGVDPEAEPSPARLREISQLVQDQGVSTIFFETLASPKVAETLADELGVTTAVLDPLEGLNDDTQDYLSIADANLEALRTALSCS